MLKIGIRYVDLDMVARTRVCSYQTLRYHGATALRSDPSLSIEEIRCLRETMTQYLPTPRYTLFCDAEDMELQTAMLEF